MSSDFAKRGLKLATFAVATSLSLMFTSALLRNPLGRGVVGLLLIGGLLLAILYLSAKYLKVLWLLSEKVSASIIGGIPKPVAIPATQSTEQAR